jgi:hypothetical protein
MKILYTRNLLTDMDHVADLTMHGLIGLGHEVIDSPRVWHVYKDNQPGPNGQQRSELHGLGFTVSNTIDNDDHVDRTDIENKIRNRYFDLIVLSRADFGSPYEELILDIYPASQIIILCGKDQHDFTTNRDHKFLIGRGSYFKRELAFNHPQIFSINCSFPKEKVIHPSGVAKDQLLSSAKPIHSQDKTAQYKFTNETDYYQDYARSYFGKTIKKYDWWDYERHYEIMAAGCVPWFDEMKHCPSQSLVSLPKEEIMAAAQLIEDNGLEWFTTETGLDIYTELQSSIFDHFLNHCTTEAVAKYVLETHANNFK